jgi:uncharacterized protein (DUF302 family)
MRSPRRAPQGAILPVLLVLLAAGAAPRAAEVYVKRTPKPVAETVEDIEFAATDRNFRVVNTLHIGSAIRERGTPGFPDYEVVLFCNLEYTRRMLEVDPAAVVLCPLRISVRTDGEGSLIAAPLLPAGNGDAAMEALNVHIRAIVDEGAEQWNRPRPRSGDPRP